ncbi:MAG: cytochrome c-type biogenesis protein CcmH [Acidimicrobiia bacterium]
MSERARTLVTATLIVAMAAVLLMLVSTQPVHVDRVEDIGSRIKCPVCQGESIADSPSQMAVDMMSLVEDRVASGASDQEIVDELLSSYSGALLLDPPVRGNTLVLWLAPVAALAIGLAVILWWKRHPGEKGGVEAPPPARNRRRLVIGGAILVVAFAGIVVVAANSLQERPALASGVAEIGEQDLSEISNATMEAVIEANAGNPQVNGMRLALAERYFEAGDYRSAFPHYLVVAEDPDAAPAEAITALVRLGWMAYDGNGEVETATRLIDEALAIDPESDVARYFKARVLWCGAGETEQAVDTFQALLDDPGLDSETRETVAADLELAGAGEACS